jgi:Carboxypeptidase regulatory-like domain/TonB dependent receptor/TonB-dependent Receptor Plug Domain
MRLRQHALAAIALFAAAAMAFSSGVSAQETTGTLRGRIVDPQGLALPGVTVTVTGPQGTKTATTEADGRFNLPFLTPGAYTVRAELQGFKAAEQRNVNISLGQTVDLPLKMELGGVTETVNITGTVPLVDTSTTTTGAVISTDFVNQIPVGRRISDISYLAPGVSTGGSVGQQNPSISGGSGLENQYVIDGVNVTNQGYGALGSYSIVFGSLGNATPYDFIKEVQVKTGGYEAEFGQSTGGVVNVVTKSGTNDFRGSVFGYAQPDKLESGWKQFNTIAGSINTTGSHQSDVGAEGGGAIVKNHVFFFGAIDPSWQTRTFVAPPGSAFPLNALGDIDRERRSLSYSAKGSFQLSAAHRFDASFFGDPSEGLMGPQRSAALLKPDTSGYSSLVYGGHNQTVRYNGVMSNNWLVEATFARAWNHITETPQNNVWQILDNSSGVRVQSGGIGFYEQGNLSINDQYSVKTTYIVGGHQIKGGYEFDDVSYDLARQYSGPTFKAADGRQTSTGAVVNILADPTFGKIYRVSRANFNVARSTLQNYHTFFVQDNWKVGNRLTINPGLRYEQETLSGSIIQDYKLSNNWAPRIGATYDLTGDTKTKVYGNFGIFYSRIPNDLASRALSADDGISRADYFDANLTSPIPNGVLAGGQTNHFVLAGVSADTIDPSTKLSYVREFVLGFEREVMANTTFGVRWINRRIPRVLEDVANCPMVAYELNDATAAVCSTVEYILTNPNSATPINPDLLAIAPQFNSVHFDDPVHKYDAVEFTLNRRFANRWQIMTSYRWSRLRGNFEGFYRDDNGQSDPGISSLYDFPTNDPTYKSLGYALGYAGSDPRYPADIRYLGDPNGILPLDRPHQGKISGNYTLPMGLNLGLNWTIMSGKPLTPLASNPNYTNDGEIPGGPRGSGIQTIDGFKTRTPVQSLTDFQASYTFNLNGARRVTLLADIFNLFDQKTTLDYDNYTDLSFGAPANVDFGTPTSNLFSGAPPQFQTPRQIRVGARFEF